MSLKRALNRGFLILSVGVVITILTDLLIILISNKPFAFIPTQLIMITIISLEFMELPILGELKKSTIAIETFVHFIISAFFFFSMAIMYNLVVVRSTFFLVIVLDFILIYLVIWIIQYLNLKNIIKKINQKLST